MNFIILKLLFLLFSVNFTTSLKVIIERGRDFCINKEVIKDDILKGSFAITGEKQDSVHVTVIGPDASLHYDNYHENFYKTTGEFSINVYKSGFYYLCFTTVYNLSTIVSFDYFTINESGHLISPAKDEIIEDMYKNVTSISYLYEEIEKNLKFYAERKDSHTKILNDAISSVQKANIYKILIISLLSILQIFVIKKLFSRQKEEKVFNFNKNSFNKKENFQFDKNQYL